MPAIRFINIETNTNLDTNLETGATQDIFALKRSRHEMQYSYDSCCSLHSCPLMHTPTVSASAVNPEALDQARAPGKLRYV